MKKRILSILLCLVMVLGMFPTTAHAWSDEEHECQLCGAIYYGDVDWSIYADCCGVCGQFANDCYIDSHCLRCGGCYLADIYFWCDSCGMCENCQNDNPETHCAECGDCYLGIEDDLCGECHRCESCAIFICSECGFCDDCANDSSDPMHCTICGECFESVGVADHANALHCSDCCQVCEQCWGEDTCITDNPEKEYCDECGLCMDCCMENRNVASGCDEYCVESVEWEEHYCEECGECWCEHEACELCGLCEACCEANSDCSDAMCVEASEYEDHFCESCGACAHEFEEICFTCGYCDICCLDARLIYGCGCGADVGVCIEDEDFDEHLKNVHGLTEPGDHDEPYPESKWSMDEVNHWKKCRLCDDEEHFTEADAHSFDSYGKCTVCGFQQGRRVYITRQPKDAKTTVSDEFDVVVEADGSYTYGVTHEENNTVTFRVSARGEGTLDYQWYWYDPAYPEDGFAIEDLGIKFEGDNTNCLTVHVPTTACDDERLVFFCVVYDHVAGKDPQSARSDNARIIAKHRYTACGSVHDSSTLHKIYVKGDSSYSTYMYYTSDAGHYWYCCGQGHSYDSLDPTSVPTKTREPQEHRFTKVDVIRGTFVQLEADRGEFHDIYCYTCADCNYKAYVKKHAHDFQPVLDPGRQNELLAAGKYTDTTHPLECAVDGCGEMRDARHDWGYEIVAYPTATQLGALHRVCRICEYWIDGKWPVYDKTGKLTETRCWDRSNMLVSVIGGTASRTLVSPGDGLTLTPATTEGEKVTGWTVKYIDYSSGSPVNKTVTDTVALTKNADGTWSCTVPAFAAMGVTGGGQLQFTAVTGACDHSETTIIGQRDKICIHAGYTGDLVCKDCGELVNTGDPIPADYTEHISLTFVAGTAKTGSCTQYGYEGDYKCGVCGDTVRGKRTSKSHGETYLEGYTAPTCTTEGYSGDERCSLCDGMVKRGRNLPAQHGATELINQKSPCLGSGYTGDEACVNCGEIVKYGTATPAQGHDWDEGKVYSASGYRSGYVLYTCLRAGCGAERRVYLRQSGSEEEGKISSLNFTMTGYELRGDKDAVVVEPDAATAAKLSKAGIDYTISNRPQVLGGVFQPMPWIGADHTFTTGQPYYLVVRVFEAAGYKYSDRVNVTLNGMQYAMFFDDVEYEFGEGRDTIKVPVKTAVFKLAPFKSYNVAVTGSEAVNTGAGKYGKGETVTIHAGEKPGFVFAGWTCADVGVAFQNAASATTTFTMPANTVRVTANWLPRSEAPTPPAGEHTVTVETNGYGTASASPATGAAGTTITLSYSPESGYHFKEWQVISGGVTIVGDHFTMPADDVIVRAIFERDMAPIIPIAPMPSEPTKPENPVTPVKPENPFEDVPGGAYYEDAVLWAADNGITGGVDAVHFAPNLTCTRAQAVTFLWRAAGSPAPKSAEMPFADVKADSYYYSAVLWAVENGITRGTSDTTFSPDEECSRAQIVTFLWRSQKSPVVTAANPFVDVKADAYYSDAVLWAAANGITGGTTATTFSPDMDCTRAQIVTFIYRCMR